MIANSTRLQFLVERAHLLALVRDFFAKQGLLEVDTPLLSQRASIDTHIDLIETSAKGEKGYLVSSPEYAMKRLLAEGFPACYQLSHVFRAGENSAKHNGEFCMIEWYQIDHAAWSHEENFRSLIDQTLQLIQKGLGREYPILRHRYWDLFSRYCQLDLKTARQQSETRCLELVRQWLEIHAKGFEIPLSDSDPLDDWLSYLVSFHLEPKLERDHLHIVEYFPADQAALATTFQEEGLDLARRFEVYLGALELANGYHELTDPKEQLKRLQQTQMSRKKLGKDPLPIDERFVDSLHHLPSCCGVAVGFDRLLMKRLGADSISDILPFAWPQA